MTVTSRTGVESLLSYEQQASGFIEDAAYEKAAQALLETSGKLVPGQLLGSYKILSLLGEGGMGEVYLAQDTELDRRVAIKLVKGAFGSSAILRHFRNEERILASLTHPNIARLYGGGIMDDGTPYFVMEYVEGARIDDFCRDHRLSLPRLLQLFREVCAAVAYAHQHLIIHRDLKPANIRVTPEDEPKLLDFGIAKLLDSETANSSEQTVTMQALMTPDYASPEQVRGEVMTTASDVYSLGVVLYELLTGQRPYRFKTRRPDEIVSAIAEQEANKPSSVPLNQGQQWEIENRKSLRGDLDNITLRALRKEPERRYSSAGQLSEDIRRYLEGLPVSARRDTPGYRARKFVARNRLAVSAAFLVLLTIVAGLLVSIWQMEQARAQRDLARHEKLKAERINDFLQRMLSFSNQSINSIAPVAQKRDVTVNEMLDQVTPQVEHELADEPAVRAQVLRTIGASYFSQGRYEAAEKNLHAALAAQERLYGEQSTETIATLMQLAGIAAHKLKYSEAADMAEKCVAFYRAQKSAHSVDYKPSDLAWALDLLGTLKHYLADTPDAIRLYNEALQVVNESNTARAEPALLARLKTDLGGVLVRNGDLQRGETLLRESLALDHQTFARPHWETGATLVLLGELLRQKNQPGEAEKYLSQAEDVYRQTLGNENVYLAYDLQVQALALSQINDYQRAEAKAREALTMLQKVLGNDLGTGMVRGTLGVILTRLGHFQEAEQQLRKAVALSETHSPRNLTVILETKLGLSECLLAQGRVGEAENVAFETYNEARQSFAENNPLRKSAAGYLAQIYEKQGKHDAALAIK